ncbi:hypothetical protein RHGRI_034693 [Rhododendron griersonianum]|uniref:RRM domain-containing protein n=1 Tax=Rhododendron griersonianum TaxID=479676 RepID=A0AAV6I5K1_9ERIC|nr:hypothetical protein RHGRI_034693 [Rhododendron griersonianum]
MSRERERERESESEKRGEAADSFDGGWIPVIRKHRNHGTSKEGNRGIVTLFVDNIPDHKDQFWLQRTFNKFGVVKDAFIPRKRSKRSGNKFGFVRYDCFVSAGVAVSRMNGVWVDNERLFVKEASFGYYDNTAKKQNQGAQNRKVQMDKEKGAVTPLRGLDRGEPGGALHTHGYSFAQALKGESSKQAPDRKVKLNIDSGGNGWLFRSVIAVMHRVVSMKSLNVSFSLATDGVAQFRSLGGREVLITFQSQECRDVFIRHTWMKLWFQSVKPWSGDPASLERFIWLNCRGVPLNGWNARTFQQIGEIWGFFIQVDDATLRDKSFAKGRVLIASKEIHPIDQWIQLQVEGVVYEVKVSEDFSFVSPDEVAEFDFSVNLCLEKPRREGSISMEPGSNKRQGEDDDVERHKVGETNRKEGIGAGWDNVVDGVAVHGTDKEGAGCRAPKHVRADKHLMLGKSSTSVKLGEFESQVGDSVDQLEEASVLGSVAQMLAHVGEIEPDARTGPGGPSSDNGLGEDEAQMSHVSDSIISPLLDQSEEIERDPCGVGSLMVRCSQVPSINLTVDLNNADCRRRRRRQLSNLLVLREEADSDPVENVSASSEDTIQNDSAIYREVRATMAIGGELGVNFLPKDDIILNTMIEIEAREFSLALEREAEG